MEAEIKDLEDKILKHKNLYYQGKPEISDFEYDSLEEKLKSLDPENAVLQLVGSSYFSDEKVEHARKMLSLNKTYKLEDLLKWADKKEVLSTFKIDGSSCSLIYKKGRLSIAKTRGDGRFGENITKKILFIDHVPKNVNVDDDFEIRGEVFCTEENFVYLSDEMQRQGFDKPTSQRNIVAGLLGRKENIEFCRYLSFQAFELISETMSLETEEQKFLKLQALGFNTPEFFINKTKKDFEQRIVETREFLSFGDYLIDGLVFSFNDLNLHDTLGETAHHPRYKLAFKFQGETKTTKINKITWQVSRNGTLTPVANVEPVELSGAKVSRVTLHNYGIVKQNNLKKDDVIKVVRSGEVIPKFLDVVNPSSEKFSYPQVCPSCKEKTQIKDIRLVCVNDLCPDKIKDEILNFIRKIGIDDLSTKRLEELIKAGFVKDITSLYELSKEDLLSLDKVKDKLADKVLNNIEKSKDADLITFLSALGISGGAYNKCEKIVSHGYDSINKIMNLSTNELEKIESFAEKSAKDFIDSLQSKKEIVEKLKSYGFKLKHENSANKESPIAGLKFCITGTLSMKRSELQKLVKNNAAIVQSSVTKETDYLITNDTESSSSKFKKAKSLDIPIISEDKFLSLIN